MNRRVKSRLIEDFWLPACVGFKQTMLLVVFGQFRPNLGRRWSNLVEYSFTFYRSFSKFGARLDNADQILGQICQPRGGSSILLQARSGFEKSRLGLHEFGRSSANFDRCRPPAFARPRRAPSSMMPDLRAMRPQHSSKCHACCGRIGSGWGRGHGVIAVVLFFPPAHLVICIVTRRGQLVRPPPRPCSRPHSKRFACS